MNGPRVIQEALGSTKFLFCKYIEDLSDADLLVRPVPGANHLAWQIGHLIHSEVMLVKGQLPDTSYPELPAGFREAHAGDAVKRDGPTGFLGRDQYLSLFEKVRDSTIAAVGKLTEADLDRPTQGRMAEFAPTLGSWLLLVANHTLMHGGQFSVLRRKLGKPVLF
jgi:hypothetical protein